MATATSTRRTHSFRWVLILAVVLAAAFGLRTLVQSFVDGPSLFREEVAVEFFDRYVDGDGRVVRRDQGSDTVSEGQSYAMLLAVALDDADRFDRVWGWTQRELQRTDGLLAWHWQDGRAIDQQPATDADLDAAHALVLAADRFGRPGYLDDARRIARAILEAETVSSDGRVFLLAGPWARDERVINPSYLDPEAFRRLGEATGDDRWKDLTNSSIEIVRELTSEGRSLPPDWARVLPDGQIASGAPTSRSGRAATGLDSPRVLIRFAASCEESARSAIAGLGPSAEGWASADSHPVQIVAAAAAAHAAGRDGARDELLDRAEGVVQSRPSYYGWAWVALGRAMLDHRALGSCPGALDLTAGVQGHVS